MKYSKDEVLQFAREEDVKFIRLAFCDVFGTQKNISIMTDELERAFEYGIAFDASAIEGFGDEVHSDLLLRPDPSTLSILPWRPEHGKVVRMFCSIHRPDGTLFEQDTRSLLINTIEKAKAAGISFEFGSEMEFYLFRCDENGDPTDIPYDRAGYMDIAPEDKGEDIRREICLTLEQMGIRPESSHHEEGPGQNEIDFRYANALKAADQAVTFRSVVSAIAARNGLYADFSPKPIENQAGNGMHINFSIKGMGPGDLMQEAIAGVLEHIREMTVFLNRTENSFRRFGSKKAPRYVTWSSENRSQLIRIPAASGPYRRAELRSPDPLCNPYLAFTLLMEAALLGIKEHKRLPEPADLNLYTALPEVTDHFQTLPATLSEAKSVCRGSDFILTTLPYPLVESYTES